MAGTFAPFGEIPYIDPNVEHVGVSRLRRLNATNLRQNDKTLVIQDNDKPVAVLLTFGKFLSIQQEMESLLNTIETLSSPAERELLGSALASVAAGKTRRLADIRRRLEEEAHGDDA